MLDNHAAWRCSIARPPLMRPGPPRVETYCSNVLVNVPRWRRSKFSTPISCCTPPSAWLITPGEMPAAAASAEMFCTKVLKSPPHRAAWGGVVAIKLQKKIAKRNLRMRIPCCFQMDRSCHGKMARGRYFAGSIEVRRPGLEPGHPYAAADVVNA